MPTFFKVLDITPSTGDGTKLGIIIVGMIVCGAVSVIALKKRKMQ